MQVRDYDPLTDKEQLDRMHTESGFDYLTPDLTSPLTLTKKVVTDDDGKMLGICYTKLQAETFLVLDPDLGPREKVEAINALDVEVANESYAKGLDQQVCYLPPGVEEVFQKRLKLLGWEPMRENWKPWSKDLV